jgi:nucleoside-diphosphate-sugar epimerase
VLRKNAVGTVLIVGCGDIGSRVARLERATGNFVAGVTRTWKTAGRLTELGVAVVLGNLDAPGSLAGVSKGLAPLAARGWHTLYYFAPPPASGTVDPRLAAFLEAVPDGELPARAVYISTSGVYGDCMGEWVTEERLPNPQTDRARRRLAAENTLQEWCARRGVVPVILRVPGIYGPGRLPLQRIRDGVPVVRETESPYSNRIHAEDLAEVCFAAARFGKPDPIYNVSDGHPTTMTDYFFRVADRFGLPRPRELSLEEARRVLGSSLLSFLEESRRLDNRRMIRDLRPRLRYPNLTSGLEVC